MRGSASRSPSFPLSLSRSLFEALPDPGVGSTTLGGDAATVSWFSCRLNAALHEVARLLPRSMDNEAIKALSPRNESMLLVRERNIEKHPPLATDNQERRQSRTFGSYRSAQVQRSARLFHSRFPKSKDRKIARKILVPTAGTPTLY